MLCNKYRRFIGPYLPHQLKLDPACVLHILENMPHNGVKQFFKLQYIFFIDKLHISPHVMYMVIRGATGAARAPGQAKTTCTVLGALALALAIVMRGRT